MNINVLETNILHASDVVYWLDGSTGSDHDPSDMQRVSRTLLVEFVDSPRDLHTLQSQGKMALWRRPGTPMVQGLADESARTRPTEVTYSINGIVRDAQGLFNPRVFQLTAGNCSAHSVVLYPSPVGTRYVKGGGLRGRVRFEDSGNPASWAILELEVTTTQFTTMHFFAQADGKGDFILTTGRLPPLPESVESYEATLSVKANLTSTATEPVDPDLHVDMQLGSLDVVGDFKDQIELNVVPGEVLLVRSAGKEYLAVQPE